VDRLAGVQDLPPIKVWEYAPSRYRGIDGYHRWRVAKNAHQKLVTAAVLHFAPGDEGRRAFDIESVQSNMRHGLPLTRDERDRAITQLWSRWRRTPERPDGLTLAQVAELFGLTKPRIHQILSRSLNDRSEGSSAAGNTAAVAGPEIGQRQSGRRMSSPKPGGVSGFGRFTAATKRLTTLLQDEIVLEALRARPDDVAHLLATLRGLIERINEDQDVER
jgi:hypothetical protein